MAIQSVSDIWVSISEECKSKISEAAFICFLQDIKPEKIEDGYFVVSHTNEYMCTIIEQNYTEHITLEQLASVAKTDSKYLCRFFKEYTGNSPIEYVNRLRVERACLCMAAGYDSLTAAALDNGFNDISYFCKIFK